MIRTVQIVWGRRLPVPDVWNHKHCFKLCACPPAHSAPLAHSNLGRVWFMHRIWADTGADHVLRSLHVHLDRLSAVMWRTAWDHMPVWLTQLSQLVILLLVQAVLVQAVQVCPARLLPRPLQPPECNRPAAVPPRQLQVAAAEVIPRLPPEAA